MKRFIIERISEKSMKTTLSGKYYDVVIDKIAYCSNDIKYVMESVDYDKYIHMSSTAVYEPKHINTMESEFDGVSKIRSEEAGKFMAFLVDNTTLQL